LLDRLDQALARVSMALAVCGCVIVAGQFFLIIVDVTIRTTGVTPPGFTLATVEYGLLYFAMFSAPYLVRQRGHVTIEAIVAHLPRRVSRALARIVYLVCSTVSFLFAWFSLQLLMEALASMEVDLRGIDIPLWLKYLPLAPCFALVGLEFLRYLLGRASYYSYDLGEVKDGV
jgi:TRAP-type C4-dicarboxylate transport system permease small subunit